MLSNGLVPFLGAFIAVFGPLGAGSWHLGPTHRLNKNYRENDVLWAAKCEAKCWTTQTVLKQACIKQCLSSTESKPGACPDQENLSLFHLACLEACKVDSQCPGTSKCCRHNCGVTCQPATSLEHITALPRIPTDISVSERRKGRTLLVKWTNSDSWGGNPVVFVLEERHHAGSVFEELKLGSWNPRHRSNRTSVRLRHLVRPGRWYQFRVAAVNRFGCRGYSRPSKEFITSLGPRPPAAPPNMTIGPLRAFNGSLSGEIRWKVPNSDLPIQRYKIFWSRRLHGATALNSVLVQHQTVPKDITKFDLKNLQPNSLYFLQVQALAQFGKERLKGEKAALVLNTTNHMNADSVQISPEVEYMDRKRKFSGKDKKIVRKIENLQVQRFFWAKENLMAKISWKMKKILLKYSVNWTSKTCKNGAMDLQLVANTRESHFNIYNLDFDCTYEVHVTSEAHNVLYEASTIFTAPSCQDLVQRFQRDTPTCVT